MKLRVRGDSLRFRLTKSEVSALRDQGWWEDAATLAGPGGPRLIYRVESAAGEGPAVRYSSGPDSVVTVVLRAEDVVPWADTSQVGLYFEESWGLKVAVEKDFQCLDPRRDEDESDNYENPNADCGTHGECHTSD